MRVDAKSSDAELVRQTLEGDNNAFSLLHSRYKARLLSYAFKKMGNQEDAEDVVQETFIEVFQCLRKLDRLEKFAGWMFVIASRLIARRYRKRQKQVECISFSHRGDEAEVFEVAATLAHRCAAQRAEITELQDGLEIAIDRLPDSIREPLRLRNAGMSYREIAEALGITENAVKRLIIGEALNRARGNQTVAAQLLGMSKNALNKRLNRSRTSSDDE